MCLCVYLLKIPDRRRTFTRRNGRCMTRQDEGRGTLTGEDLERCGERREKCGDQGHGRRLRKIIIINHHQPTAKQGPFPTPSTSLPNVNVLSLTQANVSFVIFFYYYYLSIITTIFHFQVYSFTLEGTFFFFHISL